MVTLAAMSAAAALTACGPPSDSGNDNSSSSGGTDAKSATSADDVGGMDALVKAAQKEGQLNVIALPPDWANYGAIIDGFTKKYGIKVQSDQPDAASQDEINAADQLKGTDRAPDVFDLGQSVALANTDKYAPYKVATFDDIPDQFKDPDGTWVNDYGGYMSVGYDSDKVPDVAALDDLLGPDFKGKVALNGDPTQAGAAFSGVVMASIANGGSADDIAPGVDYFKKLKDAGNFLPVDPTGATIESGQTPVVIDWDYLNAAETAKLPSWKVVVPEGAVVAGYYFQAINNDAPHPAAARLWEEYLYSDEGQNLWLAGGARPVRADAMVAAGTIDQSKYDALPTVTGTPVIPTNEQTEKMAAYLPPTGPRRSADRRRPGGRHCGGVHHGTSGQAATHERRALARPAPVPALRHDLPGLADPVGRLRGVPERGRRLHPRAGPSAHRRDRAARAQAEPLPLVLLRGPRRGPGCPAGLPHRHRAAQQPDAPHGHGGLRRARPVRWRHAGVRLAGHARLQRPADQPVRRRARHLRHRLDVALRAPGADPGLHLLPDPADGDRVHARSRGTAAAVA